MVKIIKALNFKKSFLSPSNDAFGPFNSLEAFTRSSLIEERQANTDSVMIVNGIPNSNALIEVHLPLFKKEPQVFSTNASLFSSNS